MFDLFASSGFESRVAWLKTAFIGAQTAFVDLRGDLNWFCVFVVV
jgi:hypothetical protein